MHAHPNNDEVQSAGLALIKYDFNAHQVAGLECLMQHGAMEALCALVALPSHTAAATHLVPVPVTFRPSLQTHISVISQPLRECVPPLLPFSVRCGEACVTCLEPRSLPLPPFPSPASYPLLFLFSLTFSHCKT